MKLPFLKKKNQSLAAIELSEKSIHLVAVSYHDEGYILHHTSKKTLSSPSDIKTLKDILNEIPLHIHHIAITISHHLAFFRWLELDEHLTDAEVWEYLIHNAERFFDFPMHELYIDFEHLHKNNPSITTQIIQCVAIKKIDLDPIILFFKASRFQLKIIDINTLALQRLTKYIFPEITSPEQNVVIIHISPDNNLLLMLKQGNLIFTHTEKNVTSDAESTLQSIIQFSQFASEKNAYYENEQAITRIFLSGIVDEIWPLIIQEQTNISTNIIKPLTHISSKKNLIDTTTMSEFSICMGLALRAKP